MVDVTHASLTGSDLHEPKGADAALSGSVYVANGSGSGAWTSAAASFGITGMIADFATPIAPSGWLECDGSAQSRTTFVDLFTANTIQQNGTRINGNPQITGLPSTTHLRAGYFVGGTGITNGATIVSVDSATAITISINAVSGGTSTVIASPWALGNGTTTFTLPNLSTSGLYRRSRTSSTVMGTFQTQTVPNHTHTGTTGNVSADHSHTYSGTTSDMSADHTHTAGTAASPSVGVAPTAGTLVVAGAVGETTSGASNGHTHAYSGTTSGISANHSHDFTTNNPSGGSAENRPPSAICMTCIKI